MCKISLLSLVFLLIVTQALMAQSGDHHAENLTEYLVNSETASLYAAPSFDSEIVATLQRYDRVFIYNKAPELDGWRRVYRELQDDAYIRDILLQPAPNRYYPIEQEPFLTINGNGKEITEIYEIPGGIYRIDAFIVDNSFELYTVVVEGNCENDRIMNVWTRNRTYLVMSVFFATESCSLLFESDTVSSEWTLEFRDLMDQQYFAESVLTIAAEGTEIHGQGGTLSMPTLLGEGLWSISAQVNGSFFILRPRVLKGRCSGNTVLIESDLNAAVLNVETVYQVSSPSCVIAWEVHNVSDNYWRIEFNRLR